MVRFRTRLYVSLLCGISASLAQADFVDGIYLDLPRCDNHGPRRATEELGDPMVFSPGQQIDHVSTFLDKSACVPGDNPNMPNALVSMTNLTDRSWTDLFYVGDPSTMFSNVDGIGDAGVFPDLSGLAFRIDSVGVNRPLIFESIAANDIFEPGETWNFIVQDYVSPIGPPDSFFSVGFADASTAIIETSAASIVHFPVPEPGGTLSLLMAGLAGLIGGRRRS
ncbi:MAG: hypothetical protein AAGF97_11255 [Planctomycetota bacterium]